MLTISSFFDKKNNKLYNVPLIPTLSYLEKTIKIEPDQIHMLCLASFSFLSVIIRAYKTQIRIQYCSNAKKYDNIKSVKLCVTNMNFNFELSIIHLKGKIKAQAEKKERKS
ncbi:hypothetical protein K501DRAFT_277049 [Backusella circina FSU 941]|nr:hypothetical protein K501DRAFT_277049 [Backusella circina FSU 941]